MRFPLLTLVGLQLLCGTTLAAPINVPRDLQAHVVGELQDLMMEELKAGNALSVVVQKANDRMQAEKLSQATGDIPTIDSDGVAMAARSTPDNVRTTYPDDLVKPVVDIVTFQGRRISTISKRGLGQDLAKIAINSGQKGIENWLKECHMTRTCLPWQKGKKPPA